jgi:tetratricopeptide (TPR) repeat protein
VKLALALLVLCVAAVAHADPAEDAFRGASEKLAAGDLAGAEQAFEAVAAIDPRGPWADDALAEAASAAERLGDLEAARRLWRRVVDEFPDSRQSRRARVRVAEIEQQIGTGGQWLAVAEQHEAILREAVDQQRPTDQVDQLAALVAAHPDYPRAEEARMWIGDAWMRMGRPDRAAKVYAEALAAATDAEDRWRAGKALGDAYAYEGRFDAAEHAYRSLVGVGSQMEDRVLEDALRDVATARERGRLTLLAWAILGVALVVFAGSAWRTCGGPVPALRALVRPPAEAIYFLPVAAILLGAAWSANPVVFHAVRSILAGGLAVAWLGGASLEAARRRDRLTPGVFVVHLAAIILAVAAICWLSILHDRLIDMIKETWANGHD